MVSVLMVIVDIIVGVLAAGIVAALVIPFTRPSDQAGPWILWGITLATVAAVVAFERLFLRIGRRPS